MIGDFLINLLNSVKTIFQPPKTLFFFFYNHFVSGSDCSLLEHKFFANKVVFLNKRNLPGTGDTVISKSVPPGKTLPLHLG